MNDRSTFLSDSDDEVSKILADFPEKLPSGHKKAFALGFLTGIEHISGTKYCDRIPSGWFACVTKAIGTYCGDDNFKTPFPELISMEELDAASNKSRARRWLSLKHITFDRDRLVLCIGPKPESGMNDVYELDLERCTTTASLMDSLLQVCMKTWCDFELRGELLEAPRLAVDEVFEDWIQAVVCPFGVRMRLDWRNGTFREDSES